MNYQSSSNKNQTGWWIFGICLALIVGFILLFVLFSKSSGTNDGVNVFDQSDPNSPKISFDRTDIDSGPLKNLTDTVTVNYQLINSGKSDLTLTKITTSCHCTTAQLTYNGKTSPQFAMTPTSGWQNSIKPGETANLQVVYDPKKMVNPGIVKRAIYISSNDPTQPESTLTFEAENGP